MFMRSIFIIIILSIVSINLQAQNAPLFLEYKDQKNTRNFFGGIHLGMNATQIDGDGFSGYDKIGWSTGVSLNIFFNSQYGLEFSIIYAEKGAINRQTFDDPYAGVGITNYEAKVNYVELPVLFNYYLNKRVVVMAGPTLNLLVKEEEFFPYPIQSTDHEPGFERITADFTLGAKYNLWSNLYISARYSYGFLAMRKYKDWGNNQLFRQHQLNNQLTFGLQYLF